MPRSISCLVCALLAAATAAQDFAAFKSGIESRLRAHPFFARVTTVLVERPPFLFCVEQAPDGDADHPKAIAHGYLPYLQVLAEVFDKEYRGPAALTTGAAGYALAVLSSEGRYLDFRTAVDAPSLQFARAHYDPKLQIAVTYVDTFARHNTKGEERHALLHEFVHALQHAYGKDGQMPKAVWFNEGLADYRASSTNSAASLREPPLQASHVGALAFGYGNPAGKWYIAPLKDLLAARDYADVLKAANTRAKGELPSEPVLQIFYAQAEMFVRFLHEADGGKHRPAFMRCLQAAQAGENGLPAFQRALGLANEGALAAFEQEWMRWLDAVLRQRHPKLRDLTKGAAAAPVDGVLPMAPPSAFDTSGLQWQPTDATERIEGARRLAQRGDIDAALSLLPLAGDVDATMAARCERERQRFTWLRTLREAVVDAAIAKKTQLQLQVGEQAQKVRVLRRDAGELVAAVGKAEQRLPMSALAPAQLLVEGRRLKRFEGKDEANELWLRWLGGEPLSALAGRLGRDFSWLNDLRSDLDRDFGADRGVAAVAIVDLLALPTSEQREEAATALSQLQRIVKQHGRQPVMQQRKRAIDGLATAYAERAFTVDDFAALGLRAAPKKEADGRITVTYTDATATPAADFVSVSTSEAEELPQLPKVTYTGESGLLPAKTGFQLIGSTWLRWPLPLKGRQVFEIEFAADGDFVPTFGIAYSSGPGRLIEVTPSGGAVVRDAEQDLSDTIGGGAQLMQGKVHVLRFENDGKKVGTVSFDGKVTATISDLHGITSGTLLLYVSSSSAARIQSIRVCGVPNPADPGALRAQYVRRVIASLWP